MIVASIATGIVWALIPAFFKAFFKTNESLFTLMMNYIAVGMRGKRAHKHLAVTAEVPELHLKRRQKSHRDTEQKSKVSQCRPDSSFRFENTVKKVLKKVYRIISRNNTAKQRSDYKTYRNGCKRE